MDPNRFRRATRKCIGSSSICSSLIPAKKCLSWWRNRLYSYADDSTLLAVVRKPTDRPTVDASLNRDLATIQEWCNHWCMILNPNKTKDIVVSRSRIVNPPHGGLVLSGVSIHASPNLHIICVKFYIKLTSKTMCVVLFLMILRELLF